MGVRFIKFKNDIYNGEVSINFGIIQLSKTAGYRSVAW